MGVELDSYVQQLSHCDTLETVADKQGFQVQTNKEELIRIGVGPWIFQYISLLYSL